MRAPATSRRCLMWRSAPLERRSLGLRQTGRPPSLAQRRKHGGFESSGDGKSSDREGWIERQDLLRGRPRLLVSSELDQRRRQKQVANAKTRIELNRMARGVMR